MSNENYPVTRIEDTVPEGEKTNRLVKLNNYVYNLGKDYIASISQSSTDAPEVGVTRVNDFSIVPELAYVSTGVYTVTMTGLLLATKTTVEITNIPVAAGRAYAERISDNAIRISTVDGSGVASDDVLSASLLKINVLP